MLENNYRQKVLEVNKEKLESASCFKLICGASMTDYKVIEDLSFVYSLSGTSIIDVAPDFNAIEAAKKGIFRAREMLISCEQISESFNEPILMVSLNAGEDPHFKTVKLNANLCNVCGECFNKCDFHAIKKDSASSNIMIDENVCYGCGRCIDSCSTSALKLEENIVNLSQILTKLINEFVAGIEIHAGNCTLEELKTFCHSLHQILGEELYNEILFSFSLESSKHNRKDFVDYVNGIIEFMPSRTIIQVDGTPMSGNVSVGSALQTLASVQTLNRNNIDAYIMLAGGTNQNTARQAHDFGVLYNGIAMGTFARKLLWPYLEDLEKTEILQKAIRITTKLVKPLEF